MDSATLNGIPGAAEVRSRRRSETASEYRGVFAFRAEYEAELVKLLADRELVEYDGVVNGERQRMKVRVTDMSLARGLAYFQGVGEPYGGVAGTRAG